MNHGERPVLLRADISCHEMLMGSAMVTNQLFIEPLWCYSFAQHAEQDKQVALCLC